MASLGFLDLPRRVREMIYEQLFVKPGSVKVPEVMRKPKPTVKTAKSPSGLSLLRTKKQIHEECLNVLYGKNKFILEAPGLNAERLKTLEKFLKTIQLRGRRELKYLALHLNYSRSRGRLNNTTRLATVARLRECFSSLGSSWFKVFELSLDDKLLVEIESALGSVKIDELAIRVSPPFKLPPELLPRLLKNIWGSRIVVLKLVTASDNRTPGDKGGSCDGRVYGSVFADETLEVVSEHTPSAADRKDYFSDMPCELRELIYDNVLVAEKEICPLPSYPTRFCNERLRVQSCPPTVEKHTALGLLRTSRLMHQESTLKLYGENVFTLESHEKNSITDWLLAIGERNRSCLRYLRLDHDALLRNTSIEVPQPFDFLTTYTSRSFAGAMLGRKISKTIDMQRNAINEHVAELSGMVAADYSATLELLKGIPELSRLELHIPYDYFLSDVDDHYFNEDGPTSRLEPGSANVALTEQTIIMLPDIHVLNVLRLGVDLLTPDLAEALERMGVAKVTLCNPEIRDWMLDEEELLDIELHLEVVDPKWRARMGPGVLERIFEKRKSNKLERRIKGIWPKTGDLYDDDAWCAGCGRRHLQEVD